MKMTASFLLSVNSVDISIPMPNEQFFLFGAKLGKLVKLNRKNRLIQPIYRHKLLKNCLWCETIYFDPNKNIIKIVFYNKDIRKQCT